MIAETINLRGNRNHDQAHGVMNEIYNPNPTILKTTGKRGARASSKLWDLDEVQTDKYELYDGHSVNEGIDQNEIFGRHLSPPTVIRRLKPYLL